MSKDEEEDVTPLLEWIFGAVGLLLFIGALVVIVANGMDPDEPPSISIRAEPAEAVGEKFRVEFEAFNEGDQTAELVWVVASLFEGDRPLETHEVEIDFVPPNSTRRAGVFFSRNPAGLRMTIDAVGYQHP